jgi:hypothetical protein
MYGSARSCVLVGARPVQKHFCTHLPALFVHLGSESQKQLLRFDGVVQIHREFHMFIKTCLNQRVKKPSVLRLQSVI